MFVETQQMQPGDQLVATFWNGDRQVRLVDRPERPLERPSV